MPWSMPVLSLRMREFFDFLPLSNKEKPPTRSTEDPWDRPDPVLDRIVPDDPNQPYDIKDVVGRVVHLLHIFGLCLDENVLVG